MGGKLNNRRPFMDRLREGQEPVPIQTVGRSGNPPQNVRGQIPELMQNVGQAPSVANHIRRQIPELMQNVRQGPSAANHVQREAHEPMDFRHEGPVNLVRGDMPIPRQDVGQGGNVNVVRGDMPPMQDVAQGGNVNHLQGQQPEQMMYLEPGVYPVHFVQRMMPLPMLNEQRLGYPLQYIQGLVPVPIQVVVRPGIPVQYIHEDVQVVMQNVAGSANPVPVNYMVEPVPVPMQQNVAQGRGNAANQMQGPGPVPVQNVARGGNAAQMQGPAPVQMQNVARGGNAAQMQGPGPVPVQNVARGGNAAQMRGPGPVPVQNVARGGNAAQMRGPAPVPMQHVGPDEDYTTPERKLFAVKPEMEFPTECFRVKTDPFDTIASVVTDHKSVVKAACFDPRVVQETHGCVCCLNQLIRYGFRTLAYTSVSPHLQEKKAQNKLSNFHDNGQLEAEIIFYYREIKHYQIRMNRQGKGCLVIETDVGNHCPNLIVVLNSTDKKTLARWYYTVKFMIDLSKCHQAMLFRTADPGKSVEEFLQSINPMHHCLTVWTRGRLYTYDVLPTLCNLMRLWLAERKNVLDQNWSARELNMISILTSVDNHPCKEIYILLYKLLSIWTGERQEAMTNYIFGFFKNNICHLEDIRHAVEMPNVVACTLFRMVNTPGGFERMNKFLKHALHRKSATARDLAPGNLATMCLMGLTMLYLDDPREDYEPTPPIDEDKAEPFCAEKIIDCERFNNESDLGHLKVVNFHETPESTPPAITDEDLLGTTALVHSCGSVDHLDFESFLKQPPAKVETHPDPNYQRRRDLLVVIYFYVLNTTQKEAGNRASIARVLNVFPFYHRALRDPVFKNCLSKVIQDNNLVLKVPFLTFDTDEEEIVKSRRVDLPSVEDHEYHIRGYLEDTRDTKDNIAMLFQRLENCMAH